MSQLIGTRRAAGVWGLVFVVLLLVSAAMVSVPSASKGGEAIVAFYRAHGTLIVAQQILGVVALGAFVAFALSLPPARWLKPALWFFVAAELVTNFIPLIIIVSEPPADAAHTLTYVGDIADAVFAIAIAFFVAAATQAEPLWVRLVAYVVALANVARGISDPFGLTALDTIAPVAFVAFVLLMSIRNLIARPDRSAAPMTR